jgi:eukaryotic-like serine/threonine-protein kinase
MPWIPNLAGCVLDDRYELHEVLGEGAFGRVYRGLDRRLGREVAVKVIKPWWAEDSAWVARFQREARMLARVNDPGIVQIFDIGHADEGPYYVAELVRGESLASRLRSGPLPLEQARAVAEQLCRALACAHRHGVMHCDVKPANVLIGADGRVKVGDFGVARLAESTSQAPSVTVAGTPRYMSPEQARGRPTTAASDVYSTGVVLYEMLAGRPPFADGSAVTLGLRHLQDPPPPLSLTVPLALRQTVERALAKDPAERYRDCDAMADALCDAGPDAQPLAPRAPAPHIDRSLPAVSTRSGSGPATDPSRPAARFLTPESQTTGLPGALPESQTTALPGAFPEPQTIALPGAQRRNLAAAPTRVLVRPRGPRGPHVRERSPTAHRPRRAAVVLAGMLLVAIAAAAATHLLAGQANTTVPQLQQLPRGGVVARARRLHVQPVFSSRYSLVAVGIAIAQDPAAGARVSDGSPVRVTLSAGPPPVAVPGVLGESAESAEIRLANAGLRYRVSEVAAPGSSANLVIKQSPRPSATVPRGTTVALAVSEAPRWRPLTTFSGVNGGRSVAFQILGSRWRVSYNMAFQGLCLLIVVCEGPSAEAVNLDTGSSFGGFELEEGNAQTHTFDSGPGLYDLVVSGGRDSARWSMTVEDYY